MYSVNELSILVNQAINDLIFPDQPVHLYAPVRYILSLGGKRLRPVLTLMTANLFTEDIQKVMPAAISIELFHNFTLVHDDIMDKAPLRRNRPSVHKRWDTDIALLSGDALSIMAYRKLEEAPSHLLPRLFHEFNATAIKVCEGQQLDMDYEEITGISMENYIRMINLKTAALFAGAMKTGAISAEAPEKDISLLDDAGTALGLAFQIQDDYLDVYAQNEDFGKKTGGDILNNKKTFLLVLALEKATGKTKKQLQNLLNGETGDPDLKIKKVMEIYDDLQIPRETTSVIRKYSGRAMDAFNLLGVDKARKTGLLELTGELLNRRT